MNALWSYPRVGALVYSVTIHFLIGAATGFNFPVRALLGLVAVVVLECFITSVLFGLAAGLYPLAGLVAIQIGYLIGVYARSLLERTRVAGRRPSINHTS